MLEVGGVGNGGLQTPVTRRIHCREHVKAVYCHPAYLTYKESASCKIPGWMKHKLESRFLGKISITSDIQILMAKGKEELKSLLMKVKEESEKLGLTINI